VLESAFLALFFFCGFDVEALAAAFALFTAAAPPFIGFTAWREEEVENGILMDLDECTF
jgi:hypothetical protein